MPRLRHLAPSLCIALLVACGGSSNPSNPDAAMPDGPSLPKCMDGIDNDGDGKIDFPADPGCTAPNQDDETDDCPNGPHCPQCANGKDDDANGKMDYPDDPGCTSASDNDEFTHNPDACGTGLTIKTLPIDGNDTVMLDMSSKSNVDSGTCGGGAGVLGFAYELHVLQPTVIVASTDNALTDADTVLDLHSAACTQASSELVCNNDVSATNTASTLTQAVNPGVYYLIVEGADTSITGTYRLHVDLLGGEGVTCTDSSMCGPGLVCRVPQGGSQMVCTKPMCNDGVDDDGDGKADYPTDPGCASADDNDETDDCPSGPNCPACSNGMDDDGDGKTDYPADTSCVSAAGTSEACQDEHDPIAPITGTTTNGTLVGASDDHLPSCVSSSGADVFYTITIPKLRSLTVDTDNSASDTVLSLLPPSCMEPSLACDDDGGSTTHASAFTTGTLDAGTYLIAVDAYGTTTPDTFELHVAGVLAPGASCEPANTLNGAFACPSTNPCTGAVGTRTCQVFACSDGMDNDLDGKTDYPDDPGCTDPYDDVETDTCPGAGCPVCSDTMDNDTDGKVDYAMDMSCWAASGTNEGFCNAETDRVAQIFDPTTSGDTTAAHGDFTPSCQSSSNNDLVFALNLPVAVDTLTVDTNGSSGISDTVLSIQDATCANELGCDDDGGDSTQSLLTLTNVAAGSYSVIVDGYGSHTGTFVLHVNGVVASGTACNSLLFRTGVLVCPTGTTCTGGTCQ